MAGVVRQAAEVFRRFSKTPFSSLGFLADAFDQQRLEHREGVVFRVCLVFFILTGAF